MYEQIPTLLIDGVLQFAPVVLLESSSELLADADWEGVAMFGLFGLLVGAVVIHQGFDKYRNSRIFENTATERIRSMAVGRTELNGAAKPYDGTFPRPFTEGEYIYGEYRVKEYVQREDHDGETEMVWETIARGEPVERLGSRRRDPGR